jgi:hypothetical protein
MSHCLPAWADALAVGHVDSGPDIDAHRALEDLGIALAVEGLEPALAGPIGIADDPGFADGAVPIFPVALADRHCEILPFCAKC